MTEGPPVIIGSFGPDRAPQWERLSERSRTYSTRAVVALAAVGITWAIDVTVPLAWPAGTTVGCLLLARWGWRRRKHSTEPAAEPYAAPTFAVPAAHGQRTRIGDAHRDSVSDLLREYYALGFLDRAEVDERLRAAESARCVGDLRKALADLPEIGGAR